MIQITIDDGLRTAWPDAALACIQFEGTVEPAPAELSAALDAACARIQQDYTVSEIQTRTRIAQTRAGQGRPSLPQFGGVHVPPDRARQGAVPHQQCR